MRSKTKRRDHGGRPARAAACVAALICAPAAVQAQAATREFPVKAAFLSQFGAFVTWPPSAFARVGEPLRICVIGDDPFGPALDRAVRVRKIDGRSVQVRRLPTVGRDSGCHVLYATDAAAQSATDALESVRGTPVLTVTDEARPAGTQGIVHFVVRDERVRFEIDDGAAAENGLTISSKLLSLATVLRPRR